MARINDVKLSKVREDGKAEIIVRLYVTKLFCPQFRSGLFVDPKRFIQAERGSRARCASYEIDIPRRGKHNFAEVKELEETGMKLALYLQRIIKICDATAELMEKERQEIEAESIKTSKRSFFDLMADFRDNAKKKVNGKREGDKSEVWKKNFNVLLRDLKRYEMFVRLSDAKRRNFVLDVDSMNSETIEDIESYLRNEHALLEDYPEIFKKIPASTDTKRRSPKPSPRGNNSICTLFKKFKAFFSWLNEEGITDNNPFDKYKGVTSERYGTPYYISLEERNRIADFDLSGHPELAVQRDIFTFQCCIGCRVSDLVRLTERNVIDGVVEYIPSKTKENMKVVSVPLNERARALVEKYKGVDAKGRLFPFISPQRYNDDIKEIFRLCGVTRLVTVVNSVTGKEEQRPINEVASSHMARRCFVGNLYKKLQDPNIIASMSGHAQGSRAFARYREIDKDVKKNAVSLIN